MDGSVLLGVALVLLAIFLYKSSLKPHGFPPGPRRLPIVGFLPYMDKHLVHKQLWRLSDKYGPVVGIYFGPQPAVVVNGWEANKEALMNDDLNGRPELATQKIQYNGERRGVMFVEGELWKEQRRFSLHHFRNLGFGKRSHEAVIHEEAMELMAEMTQAKTGIRIQSVLGVSNINILWAVMGGTRFPRNTPELTHLVDSLNKVFRAVNVSGGPIAAFPFLRHFISKDNGFNVVMTGFDSVQNFIQDAVEKHKKDLDPDNPRDFIDIYLTEMQNVVNNNDVNNTGFSERQLVALCSDVFAAGAETGSATVAFGVLLMCVHPEVMAKLQEELDTEVGQDRLPSITDKANLHYLEAVMSELFRFRGAAPFTVPHMAARDTVLQGHRIPAKTMVMNNLYSVHMDPGYWGDPLTFRPERFIKQDGTFRKDERLIPFGKGRRLCLGESLARMTSYLLFASLVQRFDFQVDPSTPVANTEGVAGFTLGPPDFRVLVKPRF